MNRIILLHIIIMLIINIANGQGYKKKFQDFVAKNDTLGQRQLLEKWEKTDDNDPELYVAYFNYYVIKSIKEIEVIGQNPKGNNVLQIIDEDTSKKSPVGYIYSETYYEPNQLSKGFDLISKGIKNYPNRLDMRFGKIHVFGLIEDYEKFTLEIINTIEYSNLNSNNWTWADSKPLDDPKEFMLSSIQGYQNQLYDTENDSLLDNMKRIAESVLKYYPEHVESLSNLSIVYMLQKQYEIALEPLLIAEKINPKDYIVLSNIAQVYKLKGDKKNAIKYYQQTLKYGDDNVKKYAKSQIEELK